MWNKSDEFFKYLLNKLKHILSDYDILIQNFVMIYISTTL